MNVLNWFKPKKSPASFIKEKIDPMVGEPIISFVKCLNSNHKRFKLEFLPLQFALHSGYWGEIYQWMRDEKTGFAKLVDTKTDDVYYTIIHMGQLYSVQGLKFSLNAWEMKYIYNAFINFRIDARKRKQRILDALCKRYRDEVYAFEKQERIKLMEKFK